MAEKEYIEREAALKRNYFSEAKTPDENYRFNAEIKYFISSLPAADVAPVKHGHWVNENFYTHCSACGNMAIYDKYGQEVESDYCPNCGAKMDLTGGEEND